MITDVQTVPVIRAVESEKLEEGSKVEVVASHMFEVGKEYQLRPLTKERISQFKCSREMLARFISTHGVSSINTDPKVVRAHLKTEFEVKHGGPTNQKNSGRCWIFGSQNMYRICMIEKFGMDFEYSENFIAFKDKMERANFFLEKMIEMRDLDPMDQRVLNMIENLFTDGGEWELWVNVVEKYGLVPKYAMPETEFSGNSGGYMALLKGRLREVGGILHKMAKEGAPEEQLQEVKDRALKEVYSVLTKYLGVPPKSFFWEEDGEVKELTPLEFYKMNGTDLTQMVHLTNLPYRKEGAILQVEDVGNVVEGTPMYGMNVGMEVIKEAVLASIKGGNAVPVSAETKHLDMDNSLFSILSDKKSEIFGFDPTLKLSKGDRLKYRATVVAHAMNIVGCDGPKKVAEGLPEQYGRLWKVENSWEGAEQIFMTDSWFDEYVYGIVVDKKYLPKNLQVLWENRDKLVEKVPAWDPFGRI